MVMIWNIIEIRDLIRATNRFLSYNDLWQIQIFIFKEEPDELTNNIIKTLDGDNMEYDGNSKA